MALISRIFAVILFLSGIMPANAVMLTVGQPGCLRTLLTDPTRQTSLSVSGTIDARDLQFIAAEMPSLQTLDLSEAQIAPYRENPAGQIPAGIFAGSSLTEIIFPAESSVSIGEMAFMDSSLKTVTLNNIAEIGLGAFAGCRQLERLSLNRISSVGAHAFADCTVLTSLVLSEVDSIAQSAFAACTSLSDISGEECLKYIGAKAFSGCRSLSSFQFGPQLGYISDSAFAGCGLTELDLSASPADIALSEWAFSQCPSLRSVALPAGLVSLPEALLLGDDNIRALSLPSSLKFIGDYSLSGLNELEAIELSENLSYIGDLAMNRTTGLTKIDAATLKAVPALGDCVWDGVTCSSVRLEVAPSLADEFAMADQWRDFDIASAATSASSEPQSTTGLKFSLDGRRLLISSADGLRKVSIFSADGRLIAAGFGIKGDYSYDASSLPSSVIIVEAVASDGSTKSDKILLN